MAIITTNSFDDDCLRLKICSFNRKDLCSIPVVFTLLGGFDVRVIKMIKKWISNIHPPKFVDVQSWHTQKSRKIQSLEFSEHPNTPRIELPRYWAYQKFDIYWSMLCSWSAKIVKRCILVHFVYFLA